MTDQHPITPPPELAAEWVAEIYGNTVVIPLQQPTLDVIARASQWGYDQRGEVNEAKLQQARDEELEACCGWLSTKSITDSLCNYSLQFIADNLRNARRQKPPTQAEQALAVLDPSKTYGSITQEEEYRISVAKADIIRRALERLKQLEDSND